MESVSRPTISQSIKEFKTNETSLFSFNFFSCFSNGDERNSSSNEEMKQQLDEDAITDKERKKKLKELGARYDYHKKYIQFQMNLVITLFAMLVTCMLGVFLILWGLGVTLLFQNFNTNYLLIAIGAFLALPVPLIIWNLYKHSYLLNCFVYMSNACLGSDDDWREDSEESLEQNQHKRNQLMRVNNPSIGIDGEGEYDDVIDDIIFGHGELLVVVRVYKKEYLIRATTMGQLCRQIEQLSGLPRNQQLIRRIDGQELILCDSKELDSHYSLYPRDVLYVFNRGGYISKISQKYPKAFKAVYNLPNDSLMISHDETQRSSNNSASDSRQGSRIGSKTNSRSVYRKAAKITPMDNLDDFATISAFTPSIDTL